MVSRAPLVVTAGAVVILLSACTPAGSPSPSAPSTPASPTLVSATPMPTPTQTWSAVERDVITAVDAYLCASEIGNQDRVVNVPILAGWISRTRRTDHDHTTTAVGGP